MHYFFIIADYKVTDAFYDNNNLLHAFTQTLFFLSLGPYGCVDAEHTLSLLRKILEGVEYIHSRGVMHRDLKVNGIDHFNLIRWRSHAV